MKEPPMTEAREGGARTRASRIIKARPEEVYAAFMDPDVLVAWLPPARMTGRDSCVRRAGGRRISDVALSSARRALLPRQDLRP